jgi:hypothetical protein
LKPWIKDKFLPLLVAHPIALSMYPVRYPGSHFVPEFRQNCSGICTGRRFDFQEGIYKMSKIAPPHSDDVSGMATK